MKSAFSAITATNARWRRTSRYEPARSVVSRGPRSGDGTSASITAAYTTNVSEFSRKSTVNEPGESVVAMSPPARAPRPIPRFITIRCIANAAGRSWGVVRPAISVDCDGQKPPTPTPVIAATRNPCQASCTNGYSA